MLKKKHGKNIFLKMIKIINIIITKITMFISKCGLNKLIIIIIIKIGNLKKVHLNSETTLILNISHLLIQTFVIQMLLFPIIMNPKFKLIPIYKFLI